MRGRRKVLHLEGRNAELSRRLSLRKVSYQQVERRLSARAKLLTTQGHAKRLGKVRQRGTAPEIVTRKIMRQMHLHYRTNNRDLPGSPDLANRKRAFAIFVHGCFWHNHSGCSRASTPKTNRSFWKKKFAVNRARDLRSVSDLRRKGYRVAVIWECETIRMHLASKKLSKLAASLDSYR